MGLNRIALCILSRADWLAWQKFAGPVAGKSYGDYTETQAAATAMLREQGYEVVGIQFDREDFDAFCSETGLLTSTPEEVIKARAAWAGFRAAELHCTRCGHHWTQRGPKPPRNCPGCNSPYWDRPRR